MAVTTRLLNTVIENNKNTEFLNTDDISDGYHTFGQLYYQRMMLFATLVNLFPELSWKTTKHEDGEECFGGGWFLVTIETPEGAYGYHYKMEDWDKFDCPVLERAKHWDGYTEEDVTRLESLVKMKNWYPLMLSSIDKKKVFDCLNKNAEGMNKNYMHKNINTRRGIDIL